MKKKRKKELSRGQKLAAFIEKVIENRFFRPVAVAILVSFLLLNVVLWVRNYVADYKEEQNLREKQGAVKIRITKEGKVLDFDQLQIVERRVRQGDNILDFLFDIGLDGGESFEILSALKKVYDPRRMVVGDSMIARYRVKINYDKKQKRTSRDVVIDEFKVMISPELEYVVRKKGDKYASKEVKRVLDRRIIKYVGEIENGLFVDATEAGASPNAVMNMIALYGYSVDFQRDIYKGDKFEMVVESFFTKSGRKVRDGNVLFSLLNLHGRSIEMYAHRLKNGLLEYYDSRGYSVVRSLLRTPVNGARISSGYGFRRHPVLGYSKLHKGIDFAAPRGTPIFAAGSGKIVYRGRYGGYGNFVKIRHNSTYQTAYAHISRFNRRFRKGSRVKQGDVIAYVGSTGRSTGPHLHYEVLKNGRAINPAKVKSVSKKRLKGAEMKRFKESKGKIDGYRESVAVNLK